MIILPLIFAKWKTHDKITWYRLWLAIHHVIIIIIIIYIYMIKWRQMFIRLSTINNLTVANPEETEGCYSWHIDSQSNRTVMLIGNTCCWQSHTKNHSASIPQNTWGHHYMKTLSALHAFVRGNHRPTVHSHHKEPVMRRFGAFVVSLNKLLNKRSMRQWFGNSWRRPVMTHSFVRCLGVV